MAKIARKTFSTEEASEKALLVAVDSRSRKNVWPASESLDELEQLAITAGATVIGRISQQVWSPSKSHYLGKGKLEELKELKESLDYNLLIFDDELSALQQRNLENETGVKIIDRVALIIDIFAKHARTREGILQVSLAQSEYLLPRLAGQWSHLERLGGGIGTRGPGETQIETDRRLAQKKISHLKQQIEDIKKQRHLHRQARKQSQIPMLALVGYTNTGKSTLLNALSHADILAEDKLFATLDPTTRRVSLPDNTIVLISDTVGFIRKLPPGLVSAFRATVEEINQADILLHVVDFSNPHAAEQCDTVEEILEEMEISHKPRITILNKVDRILDTSVPWSENKAIAFLKQEVKNSQPNTVFISAARGWGIENLKETISSMVKGPLI
ncbi:MAG: GTPase HflX [Dehalococcoidales bacterium]|jgi:GTP-binding protein HflX|nr:GTPase HflX [Dehalococcoidales bacterium]MDD4466128.1 GTPase HflX [Dehalococcoidales bacterium]MDD5401940.1 GTPase HflX [Dehalococcoidales bacterium]